MDSLAELGMKENLELVQESKYWAYVQGSAEFFGAQNEEQLMRDFSLLNFERLKKAIENYLTVVELDSFHDELMIFILKNFGVPGERTSTWEGISQIAQDKCRIWYYKLELEEFFNIDHETGKERFDFWEQYLDKIKNIRVGKEELILIMDFGRYMVVEFGKTGNAAYIYNKESFIRRFGLPDKAIKMKSSQLKDQGVVWKRIIHQGAWQYKAAWLMQSIIA